MNEFKKVILLYLTVTLLAAVMAGCGGKVSVKEFKSADESVSMMLPEDWVTQEEGFDNWIVASKKDESEMVLVMQVAKDKDIPNLEQYKQDLEQYKQNVESAYQVTGINDVQKPEIPEVSDIKSYTCDLKMEDISGQSYVAYGETDYAYYCFMYITNKLNDKKLNIFKGCYESFKETAPEQ